MARKDAADAWNETGSVRNCVVAGTGGIGEVYKARDTRLDRTVAIKILTANLTANPYVKARFEREARDISQLQHPHIGTTTTLFSIVTSSKSKPASDFPTRTSITMPV